jgi:hypothetical protein
VKRYAGELSEFSAFAYHYSFLIYEVRPLLPPPPPTTSAPSPLSHWEGATE